MKRRDNWYLRYWKYDPKKGEYGPEWQHVGEDRGHALARLNVCKITDNVPQVDLTIDVGITEKEDADE